MENEGRKRQRQRKGRRTGIPKQQIRPPLFPAAGATNAVWAAQVHAPGSPVPRSRQRPAPRPQPPPTHPEGLGLPSLLRLRGRAGGLGAGAGSRSLETRRLLDSSSGTLAQGLRPRASCPIPLLVPRAATRRGEKRGQSGQLRPQTSRAGYGGC